MTTKDIAFAVLGFVTPVVLWFGWVAVTTSHGRTRSDMITILPVLLLSAPLIGYAFIAHPIWRWPDLDRSTKRLCIGMSCLYWLVYIPALYLRFIACAVGRFGGT